MECGQDDGVSGCRGVLEHGRGGGALGAGRSDVPPPDVPLTQCVSAFSPTGLGCKDERRNQGLGFSPEATARWVSAPLRPSQAPSLGTTGRLLCPSSMGSVHLQPQLTAQSVQQGLCSSPGPGGDGAWALRLPLAPGPPCGQGPRLTPDCVCPPGPGARGVPIPRGRRTRQGRGVFFPSCLVSA